MRPSLDENEAETSNYIEPVKELGRTGEKTTSHACEENLHSLTLIQEPTSETEMNKNISTGKKEEFVEKRRAEERKKPTYLASPQSQQLDEWRAYYRNQADRPDCVAVLDRAEAWNCRAELPSE